MRQRSYGGQAFSFFGACSPITPPSICSGSGTSALTREREIRLLLRRIDRLIDESSIDAETVLDFLQDRIEDLRTSSSDACRCFYCHKDKTGEHSDERALISAWHPESGTLNSYPSCFFEALLRNKMSDPRWAVKPESGTLRLCVCQRPTKASQKWPSKIAHMAEVTSL